MKKKIIIIISIIVIISIMILGVVFLKQDKQKPNYTEDEIKFKEEYESLNGVEVESGYILKNIKIDADNNVEYINDKDIIDKLTNGTNVIYMGWSDCNWCRTALPVLMDVLKENSIDKLYYYDFYELRENFINDDDESSKIYNEILSIIGNDITNLFGEDSNKNGEKKIVAPTVIFIKDGRYIGLHEITVDSQENASDSLNSDQIKELKNNYQKYLDQINVNICTDNEGC